MQSPRLTDLDKPFDLYLATTPPQEATEQPKVTTNAGPVRGSNIPFVSESLLVFNHKS